MRKVVLPTWAWRGLAPIGFPARRLPGRTVHIVMIALYFLACAVRQRIPNRNPTKAKQFRRR